MGTGHIHATGPRRLHLNVIQFNWAEPSASSSCQISKERNPLLDPDLDPDRC
jgi:hypothetical protein